MKEKKTEVDSKLYSYTSSRVRGIMEEIAKKERCKLHFHGADSGGGGYNYGWSFGNEICLAPFKKGNAGDRIGKYELRRECSNPLECMLASFFHELSHVKFAKKVPSQVEGYAWNDTSRYQYELWITMMGLEYAHSRYGIKFSDKTVKWLLDEGASYIREDWKECGYGLVQRKATSKSYEVYSQWEFRGDRKKKKSGKKA